MSLTVHMYVQIVSVYFYIGLIAIYSIAYYKFLHLLLIEIRGKCVDDLMQWLTGAKKMPVLGLSSKIKCQFLHACQAGCRCRPTCSTCDLAVTLPVHLNSNDEMVEIMTSALNDSTGFDLI